MITAGETIAKAMGLLTDPVRWRHGGGVAYDLTGASVWFDSDAAVQYSVLGAIMRVSRSVEAPR